MEVVSHHVGCWELSLGPLKEQLMFLITELSLQFLSSILSLVNVFDYWRGV